MSEQKKRIPLAVELGLNVLEVVRDIYGVNGDVHHDEYKVLCPVHQEANPSCDINLVTGDWNCLSCHAKGDLATFGKHVLKRERKEVLELLRPSNPEARLVAIQGKIAHLRAPEAKERISGVDQDNLHDPSKYRSGSLAFFRYLHQRGFTKQTCQTYGIRWVQHTDLWRPDGDERKSFTITNSVAIPVRDLKGHLLGWCYRRTDSSASWQPRYLYTPELQLAERWFGLDVAHGLSETIVVCEGALDCMWLHQAGIPAIAMLGSQISPKKARELERFRHVVIFPDYDHAGYDSASTLGSLLRGRVPASVCRYPKSQVVRMEAKGKAKLDPQDLNSRTLHLMVARAITWQAWKIRERSRNFANGGNGDRV